jgi:replicative DNA helicase
MPRTSDVIEVSVLAEESLLGAILIVSSYGDKTAISETRRIIQPEHFSDFGMYIPIRARIYKAMLDCDVAPHIVNLANYLKKINRLTKNDISNMWRYISLDICSLDYLTYAKVLRECAFELKPNLKQATMTRGIPL